MLPQTTLVAHEFVVKRMLQAGVIPITIESLVSEWMYDWNNPMACELVREVYKEWRNDQNVSYLADRIWLINL